MPRAPLHAPDLHSARPDRILDAAVTLAELAARLGCRLEGDGAIEVVGLAGLDEAGPGDLSFLASSKYAARLPTTRASAVIVDESADGRAVRRAAHARARTSPGPRPSTFSRRLVAPRAGRQPAGRRSRRRRRLGADVVDRRRSPSSAPTRASARASSSSRTWSSAPGASSGDDAVIRAHVSLRAGRRDRRARDRSGRGRHRRRRLRVRAAAGRHASEDSADRPRRHRGRRRDWRAMRRSIGRRWARRGSGRARRSTTSCRLRTACALAATCCMAAQSGDGGQHRARRRRDHGGAVGRDRARSPRTRRDGGRQVGRDERRRGRPSRGGDSGRSTSPSGARPPCSAGACPSCGGSSRPSRRGSPLSKPA